MIIFRIMYSLFMSCLDWASVFSIKKKKKA
jgi:hypothetical protein